MSRAGYEDGGRRLIVEVLPPCFDLAAILPGEFICLAYRFNCKFNVLIIDLVIGLGVVCPGFSIPLCAGDFSENVVFEEIAPQVW